DIYQQGLTFSPDSIALRNNLAMSLILYGEPKKAIPLLESLHEQNTANQTVRQNLALAYGLSGDSKKALELNLKDLPEQEAEENLRFYRTYMQKYKKPSRNAAHEGIGFTDTDEAIKTKPVRKPKPAPAVKEEPKPTPAPVAPVAKEEPKEIPPAPEVKAEPKDIPPTPEVKETPAPETPAPAAEEPPPPVPETPKGTELPTTPPTESEYPGQSR
ncbi:MAG: hypothetical protein K2Q01_07245, partial [Rickettsiales bacterium]|nr:hypothetical protein [Rickettsiales bacterium]